MPRVFVINEPTQRADNGASERKIDLTPAEEFGELVFLFNGSKVPGDPRPVVDELWDRLSDYTPADFVLPVGHPVLIAWASAIAAAAAGGRLTLLHWDRAHRLYRPRQAVLWENRLDDPDNAGFGLLPRSQRPRT